MTVAATVVGIDQSLSCTGVAVLHRTAEGVVTHTAHAIVPTKRGLLRLIEIESVLADLTPKDTQLVIMEGYAFGARGAVFSLGELGGIIKRAVFKADIRMLICPPSTLKKFVTGSGIAPKNKMMLGVYKKWGVEFETDDEADAYALARVGEAVLLHESGAKMSKADAQICKAVLHHTNLVLMEAEDAE